MSARTIRASLFCMAVGLIMVLSGCTIVRPHVDSKQDTPIDWGLAGTFEHSITVLPFESSSGLELKWCRYAARRMQEELLNARAFRRVLYADAEPVHTPLVLKGEINQLYYGGTFTPTTVLLTIRIIDRSDGQTRFLRKTETKAEKRAFDFELLTRYYASSPYPEEVLSLVLKGIAQDIAQRTNAPGAGNQGATNP